MSLRPAHSRMSAAKLRGCLTGARQAGTQFPLAAKIGCCLAGASQAAVGPRAH